MDTVHSASSVTGLIAAAAAVVTFVMALLRGHSWVVPIRFLATAAVSFTSPWWAPLVVGLFPDGTLDGSGQKLIAALAILLVALAISPTPFQLRSFFFGEKEI